MDDDAGAAGLRALWLSVVALLVVAAVQGAVVALSGSVALLGDAFHNLADTLTVVPLALAFLVGRRPPNRRYTYGYGRAEDLAALAVLVAIAGATVVVVLASVSRLAHPRSLDHLAAVAGAAAIGFVGNEAIAWYRIRVGRRIGSGTLVADGRHARADGLASLAVLAGVIGVALGLRRADAVAGLVIAVVMIGVLWETSLEVYRRLMDAVDPALVDQVEGVVSGVEGVNQADRVQVRWMGHELRAEVSLVVDADLTVDEGHEVAERARHALLDDVPRLNAALVHVHAEASPCEDDAIDRHVRPDSAARTG
ncbi:MAG: cation transporter [Acidimicrobiales bacterium]|nr:cation transporter [Acidimicrobiales bacterium]